MVSLQKTLNFLFVSKVRIKCLKFFYFNQDIPIHLRAVARELREEINAVRRELMRLEEIKFLKSTIRGNKKYFSINPYFPFFEEIKSIIYKSDGIGEALVVSQNKIGNIYFAALSGSFVNGIRMHESEIDMLIVGDVDMSVLSGIVKKEEEKIGREINYSVLKLSEFNLRKKRKDPFIIKILLETQVLIIGNREEYIA